MAELGEETLHFDQARGGAGWERLDGVIHEPAELLHRSGGVGRANVFAAEFGEEGAGFAPVFDPEAHLLAFVHTFILSDGDNWSMQDMKVWGRPDGTLEKKTRRAVYLVAADQYGRVSAVKGTGGHLFLPGGAIEEGETPEQALAREVKEELGRTVELRALVGKGVQHFVYAGASWEMEVTFFSGVLGTEVKGRPQHPLVYAEAGEFVHESMQWAAREVGMARRAVSGRRMAGRGVGAKRADGRISRTGKPTVKKKAHPKPLAKNQSRSQGRNAKPNVERNSERKSLPPKRKSE